MQPQQQKTEQVSSSAFKVYCPTPVLRPPPLPQKKNHDYPLTFSQQQKKNEANGSSTIEFSGLPSVSAANSYVSTLSTGDSESLQRPCRSSGFQITHVSLQGSSYMQKPPLSSASLKRKCNSMDVPNV